MHDAQRKRRPLKLESSHRYFFMLLKGFTADTDNINFSVIDISFFVRGNFMITRHLERSPGMTSFACA